LNAKKSSERDYDRLLKRLTGNETLRYVLGVQLRSFLSM